MPSKRNFTLTELLIAVAILAVLLSLLMPGLQTLQKKGRRVFCANQQGKVYAMSHLYSEDHAGYLPGGSYGIFLPSSIVYNHGNFMHFAEQYLDIEIKRPTPPGNPYWYFADEHKRGLMQCPSSNSANLPLSPGGRGSIDYWITGFGPMSWTSPQKVYSHPRMDRLAQPGPGGPKVFLMDILYVFSGWLTGNVDAYFEYNTAHRPGEPEGMNVTSGDGSCAWVRLESVASDGYGLGFPRGYYTLWYGIGSIEDSGSLGGFVVQGPALGGGLMESLSGRDEHYGFQR